MEPRQNAPRPQHEGFPDNRGEVRVSQDGQGELLDQTRFENAAERPMRQESEALPPVIATTPVALPVIQDDAGQVAGDGASASANPAMAADEDLIEKEWVDKAKKIIEETKEDPYRRELEIGKLQRDYIRKRYAREIGEPGGV